MVLKNHHLSIEKYNSTAPWISSNEQRESTHKKENK